MDIAPMPKPLANGKADTTEYIPPVVPGKPVARINNISGSGYAFTSGEHAPPPPIHVPQVIAGKEVRCFIYYFLSISCYTWLQEIFVNYKVEIRDPVFIALSTRYYITLSLSLSLFLYP